MNQSSYPDKNKIMNLPNLLTMGRLAASPVIFFLIFMTGIEVKLVAFLLFLVAAFADVYDGKLARKYGEVTDFGRLLDPVADKFLLGAGFIAFYMLGDLPLWLIAIVFGREIAIIALRSYALSKGNIIPATSMAKAKTVMQMILIGTIMFQYLYAELTPQFPFLFYPAFETFQAQVKFVSLWAVVLLTVYSGFKYFWNKSLYLRQEIRS